MINDKLECPQMQSARWRPFVGHLDCHSSDKTHIQIKSLIKVIHICNLEEIGCY